MDSESSDAQPLDVTSVLSFSINQLQQLVKRQTSGIGALTTEGISIPPESAKRWINNYYLNMDGKLLPALVDRKLIDMMPDLITMEHVHLDACILLIYYCILWQGCFFLKSNSCKSPDRRYARQIFICCLRTIPIWKQESSGSVTDFIAAMYMTQTAVENFDFGLSWDMHKLACEYAHALRMHSLDGGPCNDLAGEPVISDDDRMGLWDLIHLDLFYRLINNKPAAFPASLDDWRVNMPWMSVECSQAQEEAVPTMAFLARTRLTFVLMRFFQVSETTTSEEEALAVIMPLCEEVETIIEEWKMSQEEWMQSYSGDDLNSWILGNLALSAYTCILFMLRKATLPNSNEHRPLLSDTDDMIPRNEMSMRISRKVLRVVHLMIQVVGLPGPESISLFLGNYRAYIAHAHLASGLLLDPASPTAEEDFLLLTQVADCVDTVTREGAEFMPLGRSLKYVNREVEKRMEARQI
ncbi:hypothetical protein F5X68DRAFT_278429 [Plectosphaerella plurivora]|uniref:Transcription factor domain-containing protein n=1 Tax=Plectosphaerella plurivora TaxID=936078 RepID=A0A9P9A6X9_9PEZI|nr:hypothetical protein F5X68DRAFT_278429 [Plectosphaerella plurivora]